MISCHFKKKNVTSAPVRTVRSGSAAKCRSSFLFSMCMLANKSCRQIEIGHNAGPTCRLPRNASKSFTLVVCHIGL